MKINILLPALLPFLALHFTSVAALEGDQDEAAVETQLRRIPHRELQVAMGMGGGGGGGMATAMVSGGMSFAMGSGFGGGSGSGSGPGGGSGSGGGGGGGSASAGGGMAGAMGSGSGSGSGSGLGAPTAAPTTPVCEIPPGTNYCTTFVFCGIGPTQCECVETASGGTACVDTSSGLCGLSACTTDIDCPGNQVCVTSAVECCGNPECFEPCPNP